MILAGFIHQLFAVRAVAEEAPVVSLPAFSSDTPLRVFLVEDSREVREIIADVLSSVDGVEVVGYAEDENSAFPQIVEGHYDVIIFDLELREGNGISLLRRLCKMDHPPAAIRIIFSNNSSPAYREASGQLGVNYFFDKLTQFEELKNCIAVLSSQKTR